MHLCLSACICAQLEVLVSCRLTEDYCSVHRVNQMLLESIDIQCLYYTMHKHVEKPKTEMQ